jgi:glycosyltransferase involved in cell wall biosynthesis
MASDHAFVVLAYGASPFLGDCLRSLREQSTVGRVVVSTSTPSDEIAAAAAAYGAAMIVNPRRDGIAGDWNFGLAAGDARYVTLAHQDDIYRPGFLEASMAALRDRGTLCFTGYSEVDDAGRVTNSKISRVQHLIEALTLAGSRRPSAWRMRAFLAFGNPLPCSSVTFDREPLKDFTFSNDFASNLDWDAWLRLLNAGAQFVRVPERLVGRRRNQHSATSGLIADGRRQAEDLRMFRRIWPRPVADAIAYVYRSGY